MKIQDGNKLKNNKLRYTEYYGMTEVFDQLYQDSSDNKNFKDLLKIITCDNNILLAYRNIKRNSGSVTAGTDGIKIDHIEKITQEKFLEIIKSRFKNYKPEKVRRVEIPKANGKTRPLGIPSIWDRIIQQCILQVLEPICEAKFIEQSYGFRPNRSAEHAIAQCQFRINMSHMQYVVDVDIEGFFDNVSHTKLLRQIWTLGIRDKQLLVILNKMLKAPIVLANGEISFPRKGTPQGGILSPLLANINLNEFDWWVTNQWENQSCKELKNLYNQKGYLNKGNHYKKLRAHSKLKEMYIVRYADDFKIFCNSRKNANKIFHASKMWLNERLKLPISSEKSKVTNLKKEASEFLGFKLKMVRKGKKWVNNSHIADKALKNIHKQLKEQIKVIQKSPNKEYMYKAVALYNSKVIGIHNYYQIATHVNKDIEKIGYPILIAMKNRLRSFGITKNGVYERKDKGIKKYTKSSMMRYVMGTPILPIGYIQTKNALSRRRGINKYTVEGRKFIHEKQNAVEEWKVQWLRENPIINARATVEFNDNRISLFIAQHGKCAVLKQELILSEMECHHKKLWSQTKDDSYNNLIILHKDVHKLIHATKEETIRNYLEILELDREGLKKVNELRTLINNEEIEITI